MQDFDGVVVFSASKHGDRLKLGDDVTSWRQRMGNSITVVDRIVTQSSDEQFHCVSITVFYKKAPG